MCLWLSLDFERNEGHGRRARLIASKVGHICKERSSDHGSGPAIKAPCRSMKSLGLRTLPAPMRTVGHGRGVIVHSTTTHELEVADAPLAHAAVRLGPLRQQPEARKDRTIAPCTSHMGHAINSMYPSPICKVRTNR